MTVHHVNPTAATPKILLLATDTHLLYKDNVTEKLVIEADEELPFIRISFYDRLPKRGNNYVKLLIKTYVKQNIQNELEDINTALSSINSQIKEVETRLFKSTKKLEHYTSKNNVLNPSEQAKSLLEEKMKTSIKLSDQERKLALARNLIKRCKLKSNIDTFGPALRQLGDSTTANLVAKIQTLQLSATSLSQEYTAAYPKLKNIQNQIHSLRKRVCSNLKIFRKSLAQQVSLLKKQLGSLEKRLSKDSTLLTELDQVSRNYKLNGAIYTYLLQKKSTEELKKAEALSHFRMIEPIYTGPKPAKPNKLLILIVVIIVTSILAVLIVFLRDYIKKGRPE
jgi:uncharacterized protein involved in exopolysaccharide biosynthesis